ncbi:hypothetical protein NC653_040957 [Populus alba x Populus x berolinensis]|uniref:Uncharacterized protein n=1 Tax=Populus alba x Populus x berolinensis TaxID=444605 RepID=A0AAD6L9S6_9ROSI|nr:hypothetical protein NC653_040957 [Populus alba x Populus x berolinensis]
MWDLQLVVFSEQTVDVIEASLRFCSLSRTYFMRDELARGRGFFFLLHGQISFCSYRKYALMSGYSR